MRIQHLVALFLFSFILQDGVPALPFPQTGDRFLIHQETIVTGTASWTDTSPQSLSQRIDAWGEALVKDANPEKGCRVRYSFHRLVFEVAIEGQGSCNLEVLPGKVILDGTAVYDRERDPDLPVGLMDLFINEEFEVGLNPRFEETEIRQFRRNRSMRGYFDLLSIVRETFVPAPPEGIEPGEAWEVVRPLESLGGEFIVPATETYRYNQPATPENPLRVLQKTVSARSGKALEIPIRMGPLAPASLRFDALGPNLISPPPDMRVIEFSLDSKAILEFNTAWGFTQKVGSLTEISMKSEVPPPDGIEMKEKILILNRRTLLTVEKMEKVDLNSEEKELFLGSRASEP